MELVAAVSAVKLVCKVKEFLKIRIREVKYFTDTSYVQDILQTELGRFNEFVGTGVSEICKGQE
jgi:hypothetical protein